MGPPEAVILFIVHHSIYRPYITTLYLECNILVGTPWSSYIQSGQVPRTSRHTSWAVRRCQGLPIEVRLLIVIKIYWLLIVIELSLNFNLDALRLKRKRDQLLLSYWNTLSCPSNKIFNYIINNTFLSLRKGKPKKVKVQDGPEFMRSKSS